MIQLLYIFLIIFAVMSIQTPVLRNAIIYLGIFSFLCSFCYLLLMAPDVAIAEAVIGCTLSTVLYLVAIKRYKIMRIYFCDESSKHFGKEKYTFISYLSDYAAHLEVQLDLVDTHKPVKYIRENATYDVIVEETLNGTINVYSDLSNYLVDALVQFIQQKNVNNVHFVHISKTEGEDEQ